LRVPVLQETEKTKCYTCRTSFKRKIIKRYLRLIPVFFSCSQSHPLIGKHSR
jgi:hypothetical protein